MSPALLASITESDSPQLLYAICAGALTLVIAISSALQGWAAWIAVKASSRGDNYVSRAELREVHGRVDTMTSEVGKIKGEIAAGMHDISDALDKKLNTLIETVNGFSRTIGRLEGMESRIEEHGDAIRALQHPRRAQ